MSGDHAKDGLPPADIPDPTVAFTAVEAAEASAPAVQSDRDSYESALEVPLTDEMRLFFGLARAAKETGKDTVTFGAVRHDQPCRCDEHKYGQRPGTDAILYAGQDVVYLMERAAIRDGRYEDAEAFGARVHRGRLADFDAHFEHVRQTLSKGARQIAQIRGVAA